jgi:L-ascorbate metabolism protein UlaG (beta-lactamase superfamily)
MRRLSAILVAVLVTSSCATARRSWVATRSDTEVPCCPETAGQIQFQYLGAGGWTIRHGSDVIMTAPFFSNPGVFRVALLTVSANRKRIAWGLERTRDLDSVEAVLAGHSHYDHLMDLPVVFEKLPAGVRLYGDQTMTNVLAPWNVLQDRMTDLLPSRGSALSPGTWTRVGQVRFMPFASEHAAHYHGAKFFNGHYVARRVRPPRRAAEWKEGEPLAFLIDFLDDRGRIAFRIYYDDCAHNSPYGYPDPGTLSERRVDVAILTVASFAEVADYPDALLHYLQPRHVLLSHWEDFFTPPDRPGRPVRLTNIAEFLKRLAQNIPADATFTMPDRFVMVTFTPPS